MSREEPLGFDLRSATPRRAQGEHTSCLALLAELASGEAAFMLGQEREGPFVLALFDGAVCLFEQGVLLAQRVGGSGG